ncbi:MAG: hypothetical protein AAB308_04125 [Nitrospirota bacterium]|jgi:hypothetical protein
MKIGGLCLKPRLIPVFLLAAGVFFGAGLVSLVVHAAAGSQKVEIVIQDGEAKLVRGSILNGLPTEISIRNEDSITHGFNSSIFGKARKIEMSGGSRAEDMGSHVYRVNPGRTMVIKLTMPDDVGGESRTHAFWCDMHRTVKGEMLLVEQSGETGG